ncbi:MAG: type II toxin-antitoxin system death-on-curing family toxin [Candidatus Micrarchaeota archaeon]
MVRRHFSNVRVDEIVNFNREALEAEGQRQGFVNEANLDFIVDKFEREYSSAHRRKSLIRICATAVYDIAHFKGRHPFHDGNKRTALLTVNTLLRLNGYALSFTEESAKEMVMKAASGEIFHKDIEAWLAGHIRPV